MNTMDDSSRDGANMDAQFSKVQESISKLAESVHRIEKELCTVNVRLSSVEEGFSSIDDRLASLENADRQFKDRMSFLDTKLDFLGLAAQAGRGLPENGSNWFSPPGSAAIQLRSEWRREKYYKR